MYFATEMAIWTERLLEADISAKAQGHLLSRMVSRRRTLPPRDSRKRLA